MDRRQQDATGRYQKPVLITLPVELWQRAKVAAALHGVSLRTFVARALEAACADGPSLLPPIAEKEQHQ